MLCDTLYVNIGFSYPFQLVNSLLLIIKDNEKRYLFKKTHRCVAHSKLADFDIGDLIEMHSLL